MSKVVLVANKTEKLEYDASADYIGVDGGSLFCLHHDIPMVCCIGDFDSISVEEKYALKKVTKLIELPKEKDVVDSEYALTFAYEKGYDDIYLYGVTGGRQDHFVAILQLLKHGEIPFCVCDEHNVIYRLEKGVHIIKKRLPYLSVFACESLRITMEGVKYPLYQRTIDEKDVYLVSNEIIDEEATVVIDGRVVIMETKS